MFERVITPLLNVNDVRSALMKVGGSHKYWKGRLSVEEAVTKPTSPTSEPRTMSNGYSRVLIQLSNPDIWERYVNALGQIRTGRLFEDLDTFAGYVAYKHNGIIEENQLHRANFAIVTAAVDRMLVHQYPQPQTDIALSGHVSWIGKTSMECTLYMDQKEKNILKARFVMVAFDPSIASSIPVSPLAVTTAEEKYIKEKGDLHRERRKKLAEVSLFRHPPDKEESVLIHDFYLQTLDPHRYSFQSRFKPSDDVWMRDTSIKGLEICHPQHRNMYGNIFGGFLLRQAYELAWAEAWAFSRTRPYLVALDDIIFRKPVPIGSLLWLHQSIGYTEDNFMQSRVTASVGDPKDPTRRELANVFHFTFRAPLQSERISLPRIIPDSYGEAMLFLDSRRRLATIRDVLKKKNIRY